MYNDLEVGSYLTWEGWPRTRVFQDPRINGYPDELHAVLRRTSLSRAEWDAFLDRFGVTSALISYPDLNPRAALFEPARWALLYRAADGLVFARRSPDREKLIARAELPVTFAHGANADGAGVEPTSEPLLTRPAQSPLTDCEWGRRVGDFLLESGATERARLAYEQALRGGPDCLTVPARRLARLALGDLAMRFGDPAAAAEAYAGLADPEARTKRGMALLALHREREALDGFVAALADEPRDPDALLGEGLALVRLGRTAEAIPVLQSFLRLAPKHLAAPAARAELRRLGAR
jgi:tetratricopeptide (TPR) repeat protein